jgi:LPS-assembly protein
LLAAWLLPSAARAQGSPSPAYSRQSPARARGSGSGLSSFVQVQHQGPVDVTGKSFVYNYKTDAFVVSGNAVVRQRNSILTADEVDLLRPQHILHAKGDVHLVDPLGYIDASDARMSLADETGDLTNATITNKDKTYRLAGKKVQKLLGQRYAVLHGFFTTCGCDTGTPDWSITAEQMDVHMGETAHARNARFNILGYPVLYLPYAVFPADTDRSSGLLSPRLGESGLRGFQLVQPYYWAIDKSSDATFAVDLETSQRVGGLAEYRLLSGLDNYFVLDGAFYDESLRSNANRAGDIVDTQIADPNIPVDRYDVIAMARQHLTPDLVVYGDTITVSDSLFLREMNVWTLSRTIGPGTAFPSNFQTMRDAVSDLGILDSFENGFARIQGGWNQDLIQPQQFVLQTLPQILVSGRKELAGGLAYTDYNFEGDNFWRRDGQSGVRLDLNPRVTVPWRLGDYLYGYGSVGLRETFYDTSGHTITTIPVGTQGLLYNNGLKLGPLGQGGLQSREMIYANAGIGTEIEKVYDLNWESIEKIKHTIEPFATFNYVPEVKQSQLPFFDQVDRIEARSLISYGFTSRIYAKLAARPSSQEQEGTSATDDPNAENAPSLSPFRARSSINGSSVEELFRFTLLQAYDADHAVAEGSSRFSDLDLNGVVLPTRVWSMGGQLGYSPRTAGIHYASAYLSFQPWWTNNVSKLYMAKAESGSFLQVSYNYIAPGPSAKTGVNASFSQFIALRAYYDLFDRMGVYYAPSYDFVTHKQLSQEYGVRIKSPCDCWAFDMGVTKTVNPSETQFQFQLTLGGLGSVGQSPFGRNPFQVRTGVLPNYQ